MILDVLQSYERISTFTPYWRSARWRPSTIEVRRASFDAASGSRGSTSATRPSSLSRDLALGRIRGRFSVARLFLPGYKELHGVTFRFRVPPAFCDACGRGGRDPLHTVKIALAQPSSEQ